MTFGKVQLGRWLALTMFGLAVVAGCGDGSSAAPSPSAVVTGAPSTPAPVSTDEPEPVATDRAGEPLVPPVRPAAMDNDDEAGARAAAEYFIELYGYATQSQDLSMFASICDPASVFCSSVIDAVNSDIAAGNRTDGGASLLNVYRVDPPATDAFFTVWGRVARDPFQVVGRDGSTLYESDGDEALDFAVGAEYIPNEGWLIRAAKPGIEPLS